MDRQPFDETMPYEMMLADDARKILRRSGLPKPMVARLSLNDLHDAIVVNHAGGNRDMDVVVIVNDRIANRIAAESVRFIAELRPDLPNPFKGSAASERAARERLGGLPNMDLERIEMAVRAVFRQEIAVLTDEDFSRLNRTLNAILASVPHGRAMAKKGDVA